VPICFNCAGRVARLRHIPRSYPELRRVLGRDRRKVERREGRTDTRVFKLDRRKNERRVAQVSARVPREEPFMLIDEEMILDIQELAEEMSRSPQSADLTRIRDVGVIV